MADSTERELAQISIYLAKAYIEFETALDWEKTQSKHKFSHYNFEVNGTPCRFVYFESETPKTNPPWLDFANAQLSAEQQILFSGKSRNANGILALDIDDRLLVATFGRSAGALFKTQDVRIRLRNPHCNELVRQRRHPPDAHAKSFSHSDAN